MARSRVPTLLPVAPLPSQVAGGRSGRALAMRLRLATDRLADLDPVLSARGYR